MLTRSTAQFCIDNLAPIVWNDAAFTHLVLPGNEKELAWAFVENKALSNNSFDDFVHDKGEYSVVCITIIFELDINSCRPWSYYPHVRSSWCWKDIHRRSRYVHP